jgi:hypothetical protein
LLSLAAAAVSTQSMQRFFLVDHCALENAAFGFTAPHDTQARSSAPAAEDAGLTADAADEALAAEREAATAAPAALACWSGAAAA